MMRTAVIVVGVLFIAATALFAWAIVRAGDDRWNE